MAFLVEPEPLYAQLCRKLGTPEQVTIRRDLTDITEKLDNKVSKSNLYVMDCGSRREGFRLKESDRDHMFWLSDHYVLWEFSQSQFYNTHKQELILCDTSQSPPGYTLLRIPFEKASSITAPACVKINGALHISSAKYRAKTMFLIEPDSTENGPCCSGKDGPLGYDYAHGFFSEFWPSSASNWISRCKSWPPYHVFCDIVKSGCHFVAIGHKAGSHLDNEWRISFTQAECKLVYSMNHTQFLAYGLLKLLLKEVINNGLNDEEKILSSYHIKTAIFWVLQQNVISDWCPHNLLEGFWVCFKVLLKWVQEGVCPNFFIPENNMFLNKVCGAVQQSLFRQLYTLYEKGKKLFLEIPSIASSYGYVLFYPRLSVCTEKRTLITEDKLDEELFYEMYTRDFVFVGNLHDCIRYLKTVAHLLRTPLTLFQIVMLQKITVTILQKAAFILTNRYINTSGADTMSCFMLILSVKIGFVSDLLFFAMYLYKTSRYSEALYVTEIANLKLEQPHLMYIPYVNQEKYIEKVGGQSLLFKMKQAVAQNVKLQNGIQYIDELSVLQNKRTQLRISPYVLIHMLKFLCYRHVRPLRAQTTINDLTTLIKDDKGDRIHYELMENSVRILTICGKKMRENN